MAQTSAAKKAASSGLVDRLSALPDGALQHILGRLPAHEAVRTSVLASRWRDLWKSVRRLHITSHVRVGVKDTYYMRDFVNPLFLLRDRACPLEEVKFEFYDVDFEVDDDTSIWVRHALMCQVQVLSVDSNADIEFEAGITLGGLPLVSRHLRKLELIAVNLDGNFLDFSSCPMLEVLEITSSDIRAKRIVAPSVKLLHIECSYFQNDYRVRISVPNLIRLHLLSYLGGIAPLLESMPLLETATVCPDGVKVCHNGQYGDRCGSCAACCGDDDQKDRCALLGGLSCAVNLELKACDQSRYIFSRDLRWCPTFSKLKTLSLNDWCLHVDLSPLVCILNHSPVLENLTLYLYEGLKFTTQMEGSNTTMEKPTALSKRLKIIKIVCHDVHDGIYGIIKFLSMWDVEVSIKRRTRVTSTTT